LSLETGTSSAFVDTGPNDTTLFVSETPYSAKYLMVFGIKFNPFLQNFGRHKMSKFKPEFGNTKGNKSLMISPAAGKYCFISFLSSSRKSLVEKI